MSGTAVGDHLSDVKTLRKNARAHIDQGPLTENYGADRERVIKVLNEALATELVCVLRYKRHYYMAEGINSASVAAEFLQHADRRARPRRPDRGPHRAVAGRARLQPGDARRPQPRRVRARATDLIDMIKEDLVAERVAIASYGEIVRWLGDDDITTRRLDGEHPRRRGRARRRSADVPEAVRRRSVVRPSSVWP